MIAASRRIDAPPEDVFAALDDLANHWRLLDRWTEIVDVAADGRSATVRLRGPLGLRRTAQTRVLSSDAPRALEGEARIGGGTVGRVRWALAADGGGTRVDLEAEVVAAGRLDRALLALGARHWLRARFADALARLAAGPVVAAA
jgi:uncharacterized protein YndB with AHSA1/START domain